MDSRTSSRSDLASDPATIRRAGPADLDGVASLHARSWIATYGPLLAPEARALLTLEERLDYWAPLLGAGSGTVVNVAVAADGSIVGLVSAVAGDGEVPSLHVVPELHERGIGRRLLDAALDDLRAAGCRSAWLTVLVANARAVAFYEHRGWQRDGEPFLERMESRDLPLVELVRYRLEL